MIFRKVKALKPGGKSDYLYAVEWLSLCENEYEMSVSISRDSSM